MGGHPWLLKLHGDLEAPDTIVLTRVQYERLETEHRALRGLVQSLMLTSHLLFVGFGFAHSDFLATAEAVAKVRELAVDEYQGAKVGTAIELRKSSDRKHQQLAYHHLAPRPQRHVIRGAITGDPARPDRLAVPSLRRRTWGVPPRSRLRPEYDRG